MGETEQAYPLPLESQPRDNGVSIEKNLSSQVNMDDELGVASGELLQYDLTDDAAEVRGDFILGAILTGDVEALVETLMDDEFIDDNGSEYDGQRSPSQANASIAVTA